MGIRSIIRKRLIGEGVPSTLADELADIILPTVTAENLYESAPLLALDDLLFEVVGIWKSEGANCLATVRSILI